MNPLQRPLAGYTVGLSISESDDSTQRGFPVWQVNRVTVQVVAALFGQGVGVVFGHDWREDGVMEAVHAFAHQMQPPEVFPSESAKRDNPLLRNLLPWPDVPKLSRDDLDQLASTLRIEEAGLPEELRDYDVRARNAPSDDSLRAYLRARGLTHLRHKLDESCQARFCIGGKRGGSQGRYPGVIEEALIAVTQNKPLYLAGLLGGATHQVIDAIEGKAMPEDFCVPTKVNKLYAAPPVATRELKMAAQADLQIDRHHLWVTFTEIGLAGLSSHNGLTPNENTELFRTAALSRAIQLVLIGLSRTKVKQS